jgi:beta-phosphoglucomutase family hydrolase
MRGTTSSSWRWRSEPELGHASAVPTVPPGVDAYLFDLDGVLTRTATLHAAAWKEMFDAYLRERSEATGEPFVPFDAHHDYDLYVDGRPRIDGVRTFLDARGIARPPELDLELGERKNALVTRLIRERGVEVFESSRRFVEAARAAGRRCAVVSSSANTREVLEVTGLAGLFEARIDALVAARDGLAGKPAPDTFLAGARALGAEPRQAAVFEDALAGVRAGRAGGFGFVVGVDRTGQAEALAEAGADVVVKDLAELRVA